MIYIADPNFFYQNILNSTKDSVQKAIAGKEASYTPFFLPKKQGQRCIQSIIKGDSLYTYQSRLCRSFLNHIDLPSPVKGFVPGESYLSFLAPHIGKKYFMRLDIQSFFDSIHSASMRSCFEEFITDTEVLEDFIELCTLHGTLPQGAITSPMVSNIVFRRIDQRILKYCQAFHKRYENHELRFENITYTRYADDLLFSSNLIDFQKEKYFRHMISNILQQNGFSLNLSKLRYANNGQISLSGFVICSHNIHLSRTKLQELNSILFFFSKPKKDKSKIYRVAQGMLREDWLLSLNAFLKERHSTLLFKSKEAVLDYLCGYRSFLLSFFSVNHSQDTQLVQLRGKIAKLELLICHLIES